MATYHLRCLLAWAALSFCTSLDGFGQRSIATEKANAARVIAWHSTQLNVREKTGRNDGPEVEDYQKVTGNRKGDAWCGSYQAKGQKVNGLPFPKGAGGSYNWFLPSSPRTYYIRGVRGSLDSIMPGHVFGIYYANMKRIGHIGRIISYTKVDNRGKPRGFITNEGNTGSGGGREGGGVRLLLRAPWEIAAAANYLYK